MTRARAGSGGSRTDDRPRIASHAAVTRPEEPARGNLPAPPGALIGREQEVETLGHRLLDEVRLLTLVGPPGVGKTRLAVEVARDLAASFLHGAVFVVLSPITDPARVAHAVADAVGLREVPDRPVIERLTAYLRDRELLLVLDNFEQALEAAPQIGELLAASSGLRVLVTSRAPLRLQGEHEFPVGGLALPDRTGLEAARASPAVALYVARAQAVLPRFELTEENAGPVLEICARLDGLPLAIELAAARVKVLPPAAMVQHLAAPLSVLTVAPRDAPERHRTLRAAIAWSHALLGSREQRLFRRLAAFAGGFTLEAVRAVGGPDVLDGVSALVEHSLVRQEPQPDGQARFFMLETIREYAREQLLEAGETEDARRKHAAWAFGLVEEARPHLQGPRQRAWLDRLERERDNLRAALEWLLGTDPSAGLRLAGDLWWFWYVRGHFSEGRHWLDLALSAAREPLDARVKALSGLAGLVALGGDLARATALSEECLALARSLGDGRAAASALLMLGTVALRQREALRARTLLDEAEALYRQTGDRWGTACTLVTLEGLVRADGDAERSAAMLEESVTLLREVGDKMCAASAVNALARRARDRGETRRATGLYRESLVYSRDLWSRLGIAQGLEGLAAAFASRQPEYAARLLGAAEATREGVGAAMPPAVKEDRERTTGMIRGRLDEASVAAAWAEGRALPLDEAIAYALQPPRTGREPIALSVREREVAGLVAQGLTNRQIGSVLTITEKTAENHVLHIMNKLGVRSRAQIAAWATDHGLGRPPQTT